MTLNNIISNYGTTACFWVVVLFSLVQISPIQVNPWSWLAKNIGKALNRDVLSKVGDLEKKVSELHYEVSETNAINARVRILQFGNELYSNVNHTKELFDQILVDIRMYDTYCDKHPEFENDKTVITAAYIKEVYKKCLSEKTFL